MTATILVCLPLCLAAFLMLALAMHKISRDVLGRPATPEEARRRRLGAGLIFAVAFVIAAAGGPVAFIDGVMALLAAGAVSIAVLTWRPQWSLILLKTAAAVGALALVVMCLQAVVA